MHIIYNIKDRMEDELKELCKKETWTGNDVALIGEMIDVVKDIETVEAMKNYESEDWMRGYSRGYDEDYSMTRASYDRYNNPNFYGRGESYARGRDSMGRYTSRDDGKQEMIDHLNKMMMNARTPEERESYRSAIEHMSRN
jgi:hypothetical protein